MPVCDTPDLRDQSSLPIYTTEPQESCDSAWEAAYLRFETTTQEICKFKKRLRQLGANEWPRDAQVAEIFCGRGNGLVALEQMGFSTIAGADLSATLISQYQGPSKCYVADCRELPFDDGSLDIVLVQGGLHHLPDPAEDLPRVFVEVNRVLAAGGRFGVVEPWRTPFLDGVHCLCDNSFSRRLSRKIDALATMIEHERETYEQWLDMPNEILYLLDSYFSRKLSTTAWGKLMYVGIKETADRETH